MDSIKLNAKSKAVSDHVAGYICHKKQKLYDGCCGNLLLSDETNTTYIELLSKGGLNNPSLPLSDAAVKAFALLDACNDVIRLSDLDSKIA